MWRVIRAPWFRYAAGGAVALGLAAFGLGYIKGSHDTEIELQEALNKALQQQEESLKENHSREMVALEEKGRREREAMQINHIPRPVGSVCDAGDDWLLTIQSGLRGANRVAIPD